MPKIISRLIFISTYVFLFTLMCIVFLDDNSLKSVDIFPFHSFDDDLVVLNSIARSVNIYLYIFQDRLSQSGYNIHNLHSEKQFLKNNISLGIEYRQIQKIGLENVLNLIHGKNFETEVFYAKKSREQMIELEKCLPVAIVIKKLMLFVLHIVFSREDNTWWFGDIEGDKKYFLKSEKIAFADNCTTEKYSEHVLSKFHFTEKNTHRADLSNVFIPNNYEKFIEDLKYSKFIECNITRAQLFTKLYGKDKTPEALRFKHKSWKILSKAKVVLDLLAIPFWLSSGTCLGFFRECDIIAHSKDVDIGIFAENFSETIIKHMETQGMKVIHRFGIPDDSLELSFMDTGGVKLDIFFFYKEKNYTWNGGTQLRSGRKFKFIFPNFDLCWTLFCGLKVRVPCQTEAYIIANYGWNWFIPLKVWDWKTSPNNVHSNGVWPRTSL